MVIREKKIEKDSWLQNIKTLHFQNQKEKKPQRKWRSYALKQIDRPEKGNLCPLLYSIFFNALKVTKQNQSQRLHPLNMAIKNVHRPSTGRSLESSRQRQVKTRQVITGEKAKIFAFFSSKDRFISQSPSPSLQNEMAFFGACTKTKEWRDQVKDRLWTMLWKSATGTFLCHCNKLATSVE